MESRVLPSFRKALARLPANIQELAAEAYSIWKEPPTPRSSFQEGLLQHPVYSVRVGAHYRALGRIRDGVIYWFWIGSHAEYDKILDQL